MEWWGNRLYLMGLRWFLDHQMCSMVFYGCPPSVKRCQGHMVGRNHLLGWFPIFFGSGNHQVLCSIAREWLSNVHHRSKNTMVTFHRSSLRKVSILSCFHFVQRYSEKMVGIMYFWEIDMNWQCWKALPLTHLLFSWICSASHQPLDRYISFFLHFLLSN